jgi:hypothetical protein
MTAWLGRDRCLGVLDLICRMEGGLDLPDAPPVMRIILSLSGISIEPIFCRSGLVWLRTEVLR